MTDYLGDFRTGKTVRFWWNTNAVAGESITRATNGTISVYKDASDTQSTTGVTDGEDSDSLTGVHRGAIDLSSDGTFYSAGSDFAIVLSGATIDGKSINAVLAQFSIENRSALMPTTAGRTLDVSAGGEAGVDFANIGSPTTTVNLSGTTIASVTGAVGSVTGNVGGNVSGSVGSVTGLTASDVGAIKTKTDQLAFGTANRVNAQVYGMENNTVTAAAAAADLTTELQNGLATASALATAQTSIDDIPTNAELATALGTADDAVLAQVALVKAKTDNLPSDPADQSLIIAATDAIMTAVGDVPTNAELATALASADDATLAAVAALSIPTANQNADALLDRANAIETGLTLRGAIRVNTSVLAGKVSGGGSGTETFRNVGDTKDRVVSTNDSDGNRTDVVVDAT